MKILFFIGTLRAGGRERRLVELLSYLKKNTTYNLMLVLRRNLIEYPAFYDLNIPYILLTPKYLKKDKRLHYRFYRICKEYNPDIIHTWGSMPAFVSLLAVILLKIPHVNSQVSDASPVNKLSIKNLINKINFFFSTIILSNSYAGLYTYKTKKSKSKVIYNGISLDRFLNLADKELIRSKYNIFSLYVVIMVATFSNNKDYDIFIEIAKLVNSKRNDVSFVAIGNGCNLEKIKREVLDKKIPNVIFTGKVDDVENLINIAEIGLLFSNKILHGEGISNSITEYMALGKPVIANDAGGTKEIVKHGINGFLITNETTEEIAEIIVSLLDNKEKRQKMGEAGKSLIQESFTIERMGKEFDHIYKNCLS